MNMNIICEDKHYSRIFLFKDNMSVKLKSVLISDPVDKSCGALLTEHGIPVTTKHKLSKDELINELQVSGLK